MATLSASASPSFTKGVTLGIFFDLPLFATLFSLVKRALRAFAVLKDSRLPVSLLRSQNLL